MLLAIVGPTGSGKTALALEAAPRLCAEIVSADSRQVYRGMDVGTAKPTPAERALARHHLLDVVAPSERYDVARYQRDADAVLADLAARGIRPVLVGGTGLYLRAIVDGLALGDLPHDPALRASLEDEAARGSREALHARLASLDPEAAGRVHPRNARRVARYLEITLLAGPVSRLWRAGPAREARIVGLLPDRAELDRRIDARVHAMVERGVLDETRSLLERYGALSSAALTAHGYPHWVAHLEGRLSLGEAITNTQRDTRAYARRQLTWFRRDPRVRWFDPSRDRSALSRELLAA